MEARKESTIKDFLEVVFRRKWIIIGIVGVVTAAVVYMNMKEPAVYESNARVLVRRGEAQGVFTPYVRTLTWEEEISSQIELVKSQIVVGSAKEIISEYFPEGYEQEDILNFRRVNADVVSTSNVIWISYVSKDPVFCQAAVNAIARAYKNYYQVARTPPEMEDFFSRELQSLKVEIEYWRDRKEKFEREWGIVDLKQQRVHTLNRVEGYKVDLDDLVQTRRELEEVIVKIGNLGQLDIEKQSAVMTGMFRGSTETVIMNLHKRFLDLKMEESNFKVRFTDDNKKLIDVRKRIEDLCVLMDKEIEVSLELKRIELEIVESREMVLRDLLKESRLETETYPQKEVGIQRIESSLARLEKVYSELVNRHMDAKVSVASNPEWSVKILEPASEAFQRRTRDYVRIALGPLFSIIVALGFAFFVDSLDHSIKNISDAEEILGLPVLASFPDSE